MEHGYPLDKDNYESDYEEDEDNYENDYEEDEDNYEFSCFHCGKVLSDDEEHDHSKENSGGSEYLTYRPPQIENIKKEEEIKIENYEEDYEEEDDYEQVFSYPK